MGLIMIAPIVSKMPHPIQRIGAKFIQICHLYHYITAVAVKATQPQASRNREPRGNQNSMIACKSWNSGACSSPRDFCRLIHFAIDAIETGAAARTAEYSAQNSR